ncbi:hypothetical protein F5J12DRAFT_423663 [Pisolithus orientalis]|uniref:uncharacterized protein n=1 Tax=Pisolithus orientalis TaxID=936130 RepID=UPI002224CFEC|nr:uncharacterized protein F5J12DRAFT_423663 [Pisolithus orientalis]KAI5993827.1 hypothetical protein F5J12DRAFT_423663 [Pisolithus orientalis]
MFTIYYPNCRRRFQTVCNRLIITLGLSSSIVSDNAGSGRDPNFLQPTAEKLLNLFPRCRILVIGQPGVGKSTLFNRVFGIEQASAENFEPGQADIEKELVSPQNDRLVLHYSDGFNPAVDANCEGVKSFIKKTEGEGVRQRSAACGLAVLRNTHCRIWRKSSVRGCGDIFETACERSSRHSSDRRLHEIRQPFNLPCNTKRNISRGGGEGVFTKELYSANSGPRQRHRTLICCGQLKRRA